MTKRLSYYMDINSVIQKRTQSGFSRDREIQSKIANLIFILEDAKENKKDLAIMTADVKKAFDSIQWKRVEENMKLLKFPISFIELVMNTFDEAETLIEIGEAITETFKVERGTRQGDPISPLLYNIFLEPLLRWLDKGESAGYQIGKEKVKIGAVADDMIIYGKSNNDLQRLLRRVEKYLNSANVELQPTKCEYISNIKEDENKFLLSTSGTKIPNRKDETIRYLGVWVNINLNFQKHWNEAETRYFEALERIKNQPIGMIEKCSAINILATSSLLYGAAFAKPNNTRIKKWETAARNIIKKEGKLIRSVNNALFYTSKNQGGLGLNKIADKIEQEQ
jgi:hypothetical protein